MAKLYLGHWEWQAPGGNAIGSLDLRSLPQCAMAGGANLAVEPPAWLFATASATLLNLNLSA
jgi:hypothetical protein